MLKADNTDEVLRSMPGKSFQPFVEESSTHGHVSAEPVNVEFKIAYVIFHDLSCFSTKALSALLGMADCTGISLMVLSVEGYVAGQSVYSIAVGVCDSLFVPEFWLSVYLCRKVWLCSHRLLSAILL